jgi:hypothetical protein
VQAVFALERALLIVVLEVQSAYQQAPQPVGLAAT